MRLASRLRLAILPPVAGIAALIGLGALTLSESERALDRVDKAARQQALLERLLIRVDGLVLEMLMAPDPMTAGATLAEAERDAMQDLGVLDRLTEEEIDFVDPVEAERESEERDRPAILRQAIGRIVGLLGELLDRRLSAEPAPDGAGILARLEAARRGLTELVESAVADEAEEIADARAERSRVLRRAIWGALGIGALFAGFGLWQGVALARQGRAGLEALAAFFARLADGRLSARIDPIAPDELGRLGAAANRTGEALERAARAEAEARRAMAAALERRTAEMELGTARLREIDATRRRFLGDLGHALKTPLAVARGACENAQIALSRRGEPTARLETAVAAIDDVTGRVSELLSLARAEDGRLARLVETIELFDFLDGRVAALRALPKGGGLTFAYGGEEPILVAADRRDLARACDALLENALDHGRPGVEVTLEAVGDAARIRVRDQGPGLPDALGDLVFERHVSGRGGTGIGLSMARGLVEEMGGALTVGPAPGGGTEAAILLPRIAEEAA